MDGANDPVLAQKLKQLREMEERIQSKKAFLAQQTVELSSSDDKQLYTSKATPLRDRVHFILQQRETSGFLSKLESQRERAALSCLGEDLVMDHPLKIKLKALMRRRILHQKELDIPPPPSPLTQEDDVNRGFDFFLRLLNKGADMECKTPEPRPRRSVSPASHQDKVRQGSENFHRFPVKEVEMIPDTSSASLQQTVSGPVYQQKGCRDLEHVHGLPKKGMNMVPDILPTPPKRSSSPPIQKENMSTGIRKKEDEVPDTTPPTRQTTPLSSPGTVSQGLDCFLRLLQRENGTRKTVVSHHSPPPQKSVSPPDRSDEDSRPFYEGEDMVPRSPTAPLRRSVSPLLQKNNVTRGPDAFPTKRDAKSPDFTLPAPPQSVTPTEDKTDRGFKLFLSLLNKGADMVPDIIPMPRQQSTSPPRQKDQVMNRGFHNEGEKVVPNRPTPPPKNASPPIQREEFSRGLKRPLNPGKALVPNMSSAPPYRSVSPSAKNEKISKGFEFFLSLLNKGVDMELLHNIVTEPGENRRSGETSNSITCRTDLHGSNNETPSQECKRGITDGFTSKDQSPYLGGSEAADKTQKIIEGDGSGRSSFQPDSPSRKRSKDFLTFCDQPSESSVPSKTAGSVKGSKATRCHVSGSRSKSPITITNEDLTSALGSRVDSRCSPMVKKTGKESQGKTKVFQAPRSPSKSLTRAAKMDRVSRRRSTSPKDKKTTDKERRSSSSRNCHKSWTPEKKVVEVKPTIDEKQLQIQNILNTLGLDLEAKDLSELAARTQERLYGKKVKNKTIAESSPTPQNHDRSANKGGPSNDRRRSSGGRPSSAERLSGERRRSWDRSPTCDRRRSDSRDRRRSWGRSPSGARSPSRSSSSPRPRLRSSSSCRRTYNRSQEYTVDNVPEQSYDYSFGNQTTSGFNPYVPSGESMPGPVPNFDFGFPAPVYPVTSYGPVMDYAGINSGPLYAHHSPYPPQQYCQPPIYNTEPFIHNFQYPPCVQGPTPMYPPDLVRMRKTRKRKGKKNNPNMNVNKSMERTIITLTSD